MLCGIRKGKIRSEQFFERNYMENYLESIKNDLDLSLENFIFDENNEYNFIIQLENYLDENLKPMLYFTDVLVDYWINIEEDNYNYNINIGVQIGEHDDAKIYNLETTFKY